MRPPRLFISILLVFALTGCRWGCGDLRHDERVDASDEQSTPPDELATLPDPQPIPDASNPILLSDRFDLGPGLFSRCNAPDNVNSTWEWGAPSSSLDISSCAGGGGRCWGTRLTGDYSPCEKSCVRSTSLNLAAFTGTIHITLQVNYQFERSGSGESYDGATVAFRGVTGDWVFVDPTDGSYTRRINLGESESVHCRDAYAYPTWPGWVQPPGTAEPSDWQTKEFIINHADHPELFHEQFFFALFVLSDPLVFGNGIYVDNVDVRLSDN